MYAQAIALASLASAVMAIPQSAPPAYGSADPASSSVAPPAYSSEPVSAPVYSTSTYASASGSAPVYSSAAVSSAPVPSGSAYPSCWSACFAQAQISSESELCGNTAVDACIQDECTAAEDQAYWAWYESYCPATSSAVTTASTAYGYSTSAVVTSPIPTSSAYPSCWSACFAENDVTSEAELCGDDAVSQCIYETCDSGDDQAYWAWYDGYCTGAATVTSVVTLTSPCAYTSGTVVVTTGWESTVVTPAGAPTGSGAAPYPSGATGGAWGSTAAATGTSAAWPSAATSSGWPVVPATGSASTVAKSGFALLAGFLGLVALL